MRARGFVRALLGGGIFVGAALVAAPARAECGDFGGIGVLAGAGLGMGAATVGAFAYPGIAIAVKPGIPYWPGVGYTMAAGTVGAVLGTVALSSECPNPESLYVPTLVAVSLGAVTTIGWAAAATPRPRLAVYVARPATDRGGILGVRGEF